MGTLSCFAGMGMYQLPQKENKLIIFMLSFFVSLVKIKKLKQTRLLKEMSEVKGKERTYDNKNYNEFILMPQVNGLEIWKRSVKVLFQKYSFTSINQIFKMK